MLTEPVKRRAVSRSAVRTDKTCPRCGVQNPECGFGMNRYNRDGLADYCTICGRLGGSVARERQKVLKSAELIQTRLDAERTYREAKLEPELIECGGDRGACNLIFTNQKALDVHRALRHPPRRL